MRTRSPTVTSLSTCDPRPTTLRSPIRARSRTWAWSPITAPGAIRAPATTMAPAQIVAPTPMTTSLASAAALERGPRASGLPTIAPSWMRAPAETLTPSWMTTFAPSSRSTGSEALGPTINPGARSEGCSTRAPVEALLQGLQHPHHAQPAARARAWLLSVAHAGEEMAALDPQRLLVGDVRAHHVARARDVLPVGLEVLVEALVVDLDLLAGGHVVEGRHLL